MWYRSVHNVREEERTHHYETGNGFYAVHHPQIASKIGHVGICVCVEEGEELREEVLFLIVGADGEEA